MVPASLARERPREHWQISNLMQSHFASNAGKSSHGCGER